MEESELVTENIPLKIINKRETLKPFKKYQLIYKIWKNLKNYIFTFIGSILYISTLEGCYLDYDECINLYKKKATLIILIMLLSALSFFVNFVLYFIKKVPRNSIFFEILVILYLCFIYDTGSTVKNHGSYNRVFLLSVLSTFIIIYLSFYILYKIYLLIYKWNKYIALILFIYIFIIFPTNIYLSISSSCDNWDKGFKNSFIDNTKPCFLLKPNICYENIFNNILDMTRNLNIKCYNTPNNSKDLLIKYSPNLKNSSVYIGFPQIEEWEFEMCRLDNYHKNVLGRVIDMNDTNISNDEKNKIETIIDFSNEYNPKVVIEIKRKEKVAEVRKKFVNKDLPQNIILLFIDSVSRNQFKRKLQKTWSWLEDLYDSNGDYESFQFLKYHGNADYTIPNVFPLLFGNQYYYNDGKEISNYFKDNGFVTASVMNMCVRGLIDIQGFLTQMAWEKYDHEFSSVFCDPNFVIPDQSYPLMNGPYSIIRKCLYGKQTINYAINYTKQFFNIYKNESKFLRFGIIDGHEGTGEVIKYDDEYIHEYLEFLKNEGHLKNSVLLILSDHGFMMPGLHHTFRTEDHMKDLLLPFLSFVLPKKYKNFDMIKRNLKWYENLLVSSYDVHKTLISILNIEDKKIGNSLFYTNTSRSNICEEFLTYNETECRCANEYHN